MSILSIIVFLICTVLCSGCSKDESFSVHSDKFKNSQGCYVMSNRFRSSHNSMYISYPTEDRKQSNYLNVDTSSGKDNGTYVLSFYGDDGSNMSCTSTMNSEDSPVHIKWWEKCISDEEKNPDVDIGDNDISITCGCGNDTEFEEYMGIIDTGSEETHGEDGKYKIENPTTYPIGFFIFLFYVFIATTWMLVYVRCFYRRTDGYEE